MMHVTVIGAGYVGLVQATGLAHLGHSVRLSDANAARIAELKAGRLPIFEPGLQELFERGLDHGLLSFHHDNLTAVDGADVIFMTLPTPPDGNGRADLTIVERVVDQLAPVLPASSIVVTKSTVPVGTAKKLRDRMRVAGCEAGVVSNPEFLSEGHAVEDFLNADRIVIGAFDESDAQRITRLYSGLPAKIVVTDPVSAELTKYAANAYLATRLTFANSIANLAEHVGADALQVLDAMGMDRRIGRLFLKPGPGYGGSCFPKDTSALVWIAEDAGYDFELVRTVIEVDKAQRARIVDRSLRLLGGDAAGKKIAVWGIAFKAGTDDIRESPALAIAHSLEERGAKVAMADPEAGSEEFEWSRDPIQAATDADLVIVATEWPEFLRVELSELARVMRGRIVYDVRNLLDPVAVRAAGLDYIGWGRPNV